MNIWRVFELICICRTFKYIERELPKVPPHIPVLVLVSLWIFLILNLRHMFSWKTSVSINFASLSIDTKNNLLNYNNDSCILCVNWCILHDIDYTWFAVTCYMSLFVLCFCQANHRDMGEHRLVPTEEVVAFIQHLER